MAVCDVALLPQLCTTLLWESCMLQFSFVILFQISLTMSKFYRAQFYSLCAAPTIIIPHLAIN